MSVLLLDIDHSRKFT